MSKVSEKQKMRRAEILEAVLPIITSRSFEDISISEICSEIGISIGSFYHYFKSKSDLLTGFLSIIDNDMRSNVLPLMTSDDEIENLKIFAHGWAVHVAAHGIERSKLISGINPNAGGVSEPDRDSLQILRDVMFRGQEKKQITAKYSAEELSRMFLLSMRGMTMDWSRRDGSYPLVEKMDQYMAFCLKAFAA